MSPLILAFSSNGFKKLGLVIASSAFALLLAEALLRVLIPDASLIDRVSPTPNQYEFYRFDERLGWSHTPRSHGIHEREEFRYQVNINSEGMRQGPVTRDRTQERLRIAFLGDSFVWGLGVADEHRFTDLLAQDNKIETLNFAVSGYAPVQYEMQLDEVLAFDLDIVFVSICANDFADNVLYRRYGYYKPFYELVEDRLMLKGYPIRNIRTFGAPGTRYTSPAPLGRSRLWTLSENLLDRYFRSEQAGLLEYEGLYETQDWGESQREAKQTAIEINQRLLSEMKKKCMARGLDLVLVSSPSKSDYDHRGKVSTLTDILNQTAEALVLDFIDGIPRLRREDFWDHDGHWRPSGHREMAGAIRDFLEKKGLL